MRPLPTNQIDVGTTSRPGSTYRSAGIPSGRDESGLQMRAVMDWDFAATAPAGPLKLKLTHSHSTGALTTGKSSSRSTSQREKFRKSMKLDPIDRSWMALPKNLRLKLAELKANEHKPRIPIMNHYNKRALKKWAPKPKPRPAVDEKKLEKAMIIRNAVNDLHSHQQLNWKTKRMDELGTLGQGNASATSEAQRYNMFNFPTTGNIYKVPYHAAAASTYGQYHDLRAAQRNFHKFKRRPLDWI